MLGEAKIIVLFLPKFDLSPFRPEFAIRSPLLVSEELLLSNGVVTGLLVLIDLTGIKKALQYTGDNTLVFVVNRLGPFVILHIELLPKSDEPIRHTPDELSWGQPLARG